VFLDGGAELMVEIKKILFPCDLTENAARILPYAISLSERYNATIYLLHVVEDFSRWTNFYIPHTPVKEMQDQAFKNAEERIERVCEERLEGCVYFIRVIQSGEPAEEILKYIDTEGIDLVVMGTHGRKGLEHAVFGSVAENVVKKSPVPVVVINPYTLKDGRDRPR
jgi:nucleotide-binding universal stress UspA family protein